ncbi:putative uncharacterized protein [Bacteroides sp. CAG:714]|nr:putative uncharacterized protein [Bacteroides sp. CAG:714]
MKLNKLFLMAAMGLGLFACSENELEGNGPDSAQAEGTTYVGLKINFNSSSTRADGDQPIDGDEDHTLYDDPEDGNEALIKDVRIVVTDENGNVQYNDVVTDIDADKKYVFQIPSGIKNFYAVVNGNSLGLADELKSWDGDQLTLLKKASDLYDFNASGTAGKGFLMSSVSAVQRPIQDNVTETDVIAGKANNVEITVERVVAKVTMQLSENLVAEGGFNDQTATLKGLTCQIGNADNIKYNKSGASDDAKYSTAGMYLMAFNNTSGVRETPYYNYVEKDGAFWDNFSENKLLDNEQSIYPVDNNTPKTARFYCLENTHASGNYLQSNTTFIKVAAQMIPNSAKKFTYSADAEPKVTISNRDNMPAEPQTFYVITAAPDQNDLNAYVFAVDLAKLYATLVTDGSASAIDDQAADVVTALAAHGYYFTEPYKGGYGYYNIWVNDMKDANGEILKIAPIFRNDWYNLTIQSLKLPGSPTGDLEPEEPIHPNTYVGVTLTVRDWNKVNHNVNLQ